jgi:hypothetical protein
VPHSISRKKGNVVVYVIRSKLGRERVRWVRESADFKQRSKKMVTGIGASGQLPFIGVSIFIGHPKPLSK